MPLLRNDMIACPSLCLQQGDSGGSLTAVQVRSGSPHALEHDQLFEGYLLFADYFDRKAVTPVHVHDLVDA